MWRSAGDPASSQHGGASSSPADGVPAEAHAPPDALGTSSSADPGALDQPVARRGQALSEEAGDCMALFWRWVRCGGPGGRVTQLYVNGRLARCMDDFWRMQSCLRAKVDAGAGPQQRQPDVHPLWHIRTRGEAGAFWAAQYEHLGARRAAALGTDEDGGRLPDIRIPLRGDGGDGG